MHTPGPWDIFTDTEDCTVVHIGAPLLPYVATAFGDDPHSITPQQMANAVLLSAAPDLLASLHDLLIYFGPQPDADNGLDELLTQARAAIARAKGQA